MWDDWDWKAYLKILIASLFSFLIAKTYDDVLFLSLSLFDCLIEELKSLKLFTFAQCVSFFNSLDASLLLEEV